MASGGPRSQQSILGGFASWYHGRPKKDESKKSSNISRRSVNGPKTVVDTYGFEHELTAKQQAARASCEAKIGSRSQRWHKYQDRGQLPTNRKNTQFKMLIRKGIPQGLRSWVWMETSGAQEHLRNAPADKSYGAYLKQALQHSPFDKQIELDLPRTFPGHPWLQSEEGQKALGKVLLAYSAKNPTTGYCQSMNYLAGMLLLVLDKNEEKAFWLLSTLIEEILYAGTYEKNLNGCHVEMRSLEDIVAHKLPRLAKHLKNTGCDMSLIATDWYLCLFSTSLPCETCVRIWDSLFYEGPKILFRISVAILNICERSILSRDNAGEVLKVVKDIARGIHHRDRLMKLAFEGIGGLPMNTIKNIRKVKQKDVDQMLRIREEQMSSAALTKNNRWSERDADESVANSDGASSVATALTETAEIW